MLVCLRSILATGNGLEFYKYIINFTQCMLYLCKLIGKVFYFSCSLNTSYLGYQGPILMQNQLCPHRLQPTLFLATFLTLPSEWLPSCFSSHFEMILFYVNPNMSMAQISPLVGKPVRNICIQAIIFKRGKKNPEKQKNPNPWLSLKSTAGNIK